MNILITGGCGFIGVNLIDYLLKNTTYKITVLDNLSVGKQGYISEFDVEFVKGDILDTRLVERLIKKVDAIIHLAADTGVIDSVEDPQYNFDVNTVGTHNLLLAAKEQGVDRFVMASTGGAILGDVEPPVHENMPPKPISPYGASKLCGEAYCSAFAGSYGMKTVALRFSNVYGPRSYHKGSAIAHFFKQILDSKGALTVYGDGSQTRDFVYVEDLCEAIYKSLSVETGGQAYQLGMGVETSVNELIEKIRQCVGSKNSFEVEYAPAREGEILRNFSDISLARSVLDYDPKTNLNKGLGITWKWFQSQQNASSS